MNNTSIVILTYNNLDYNIQCIQSIREYTDKNSYEIIVVDNGSTDGTREWLKTQNDLKLVFPEYNTGFPKGCNLGINAANNENDILLLNNDIVVTPSYLTNLKKCLYSSDNIGAVGPITNYAWNNQSIKTNYQNIQDMIEFAKTINISDKTKWEPKAKLVGFCLLIKRSVLDEVGYLDEEFSPGNFEDDDYCVRITKKGYSLYACNDCFIHHYGNISFKKEPIKFNNTIAVNSEKFRKKWGFDASLTENYDSEIVSFINEESNKNMNILEVNFNRGTTLLRLKYLYPNAKLYGIENNKNITDIIKNIINISSKDIEDFPLEFDEGLFDYIILGDYISHCKDPKRLLCMLKKHLKKDGYIIFTVPNLIHYSVIRDMLNGNFLYGSNGFLNKEQNNFFTYYDINKIAEECGYNMPFILYWFNLRSEDDEEFLNKLCNVSSESMRWNYTCYKYMAKLQNKI